MRITRQMIRQFIMEQAEAEAEEAVEGSETVEDAWAGGDNLVHDIDYSKVSGGESNVAEPEVLDIIVAEVRRRISEMQAHPQVVEGEDQNKDGKNDFDDVKIARMKASGMSTDEIKKKYPKLFENVLRRIFSEAVMTERGGDANKRAMELLIRDYEVIDDDTRYPYGRYRGDVRKKTVYARRDGQPVPEADINLLKARDAKVREEGGPMAALAGVYTSSLSDDGSQIVIDYYRHTAG